MLINSTKSYNRKYIKVRKKTHDQEGIDLIEES